MEATHIEVGKKDKMRFNNLILNADFRNTREYYNYYTIYFPGFVYKISKSKLNQFQLQKLQLVVKEAA